MADKEKKVKKKKAKEESAPESAAETAAETPASAATPADSQRGSTRGSGSRRAKKAPSSVFVLFSQKQIAEFKEAFALMDNDKDGIIGKSDLRSTFDALGKLASDKELDEMLGEAQGPLNFTQLLTLFAARMSGGGATDDDETIVAAFKSFDNNGKIDSEKLRTSLVKWGDRFTEDEVDDAFDQMVIDDKGFIDTPALITMLTGSEEGEEE
jgi:Ca2+-binding EF-hand superfamily protein